MNYSHEEVFKIRTNEIDQHKQLTATSLIQLMQEASMQNVINLKASVWDLESLNISWVLLKKELTVIKLPKLGEQIRILTYPAGFDRVFAYRDYKAYDIDGLLLAYASSTWTLMNTLSRKMVKIPKDMFDFDSSLSHEILPKPSKKPIAPQHPIIDKNYIVNWFNLDWNGHVNNVFIISCLLETLPEQQLINGKLLEFVVHFRTEALWKDILSSQFEWDGASNGRHAIYRKRDQKVIAVASSKWSIDF